MTERTAYMDELITCIRHDRKLWEEQSDQMLEQITETQLVKLQGSQTARDLGQLLEQAVIRQYQVEPSRLDLMDLRMDVLPIMYEAITRLKIKHIQLIEACQKNLEDNRHLVKDDNMLVELDSKVKEYGTRLKRLRRSMMENVK